LVLAVVRVFLVLTLFFPQLHLLAVVLAGQLMTVAQVGLGVAVGQRG
jgi:hypothetical protein